MKLCIETHLHVEKKKIKKNNSEHRKRNSLTNIKSDFGIQIDYCKFVTYITNPILFSFLVLLNLT